MKRQNSLLKIQIGVQLNMTSHVLLNSPLKRNLWNETSKCINLPHPRDLLIKVVTAQIQVQ